MFTGLTILLPISEVNTLWAWARLSFSIIVRHEAGRGLLIANVQATPLNRSRGSTVPLKLVGRVMPPLNALITLPKWLVL